MIADPDAFIRAETRLLPVPHAPEISLHVADEATGLWQRTEDELGEIGLPPPFWAFAWAGGQALARYVLDHPAVSTVIAGMRSVRNVERNCATSDGRRLTDHQREIIRAHRWERNFYLPAT